MKGFMLLLLLLILSLLWPIMLLCNDGYVAATDTVANMYLRMCYCWRHCCCYAMTVMSLLLLILLLICT